MFVFLFVFAGTGLRFTVPPPATASISASCWLSRGPPSSPAPLVTWRLLQINVRRWKRATSSAPSFYTVRNNPPISLACTIRDYSIYGNIDLIQWNRIIDSLFWTLLCRCSGEVGCDEQGHGVRSVGLQSSELG